MHRSVIVAGLIATLGAPAFAQEKGGPICQDKPCFLSFEWQGSGGSMPDQDRKYGSPSDLESIFVSRLSANGFRLAAAGQPSSMIITVRITPLVLRPRVDGKEH